MAGARHRPVNAGAMAAMAESALGLYSAVDLAAVESGVVDLAIRMIPRAVAGLAAASVVDGMLVVSDQVVDEADRLQREYGEGPRLLAAVADAVVCVVDTAADVRWPAWGQDVAALGLRSMLSVELSARSAGVGALVLYAPDPGWFGCAEQQVAIAIARHASVAIAARRQVSGLRYSQEHKVKLTELASALLGKHVLPSPLHDAGG